MGKIRTAYRGYTASEMKTRSDLPAQSDITVSGSEIDCYNISLNAAAALVGDATKSLAATCELANKWSAFSPSHKSITDLEFINELEAPYSLGEFAGYNHDAEAPHWPTGAYEEATEDKWVLAGEDAEIPADIDIGEIRWEDFNAVGVAMIIRDQYDSILGGGVVELDSSVHSDVSLNGVITGGTTDKTLTVEIVLVSDLNDYADYPVCFLPITNNPYNVALKNKQATEWHYADTGNMNIPSPWTQSATAGFNPTTGYFDIGSISASVDYVNIQIKVTLYDWTYSVIGTANIYNDAYYTPDSITGSVYLGLAPVAAYGYHVVVEFLETS